MGWDGVVWVEWNGVDGVVWVGMAWVEWAWVFWCGMVWCGVGLEWELGGVGWSGVDEVRAR